MGSEIISGFIGGLLVYGIQYFVDGRKKKKEMLRLQEELAIANKELLRVGAKSKKFLDENFLNTYTPGTVSIEKIAEDLGKPLEVYEESTKQNKPPGDIEYKYTVYKYKFSNAIVLFTTLAGESSIISVTLASTDDAHPVDCPLSPGSETENTLLGHVVIDKSVIEGSVAQWSDIFKDWGYSAIQARYFYRYIKHLTYTYFVHEILEKPEDIAGKLIGQVCISQLTDVHPYIYFYEIN